MHHEGFFATRGKHKARRHQRIRSLKFPDQRQIDGMGFLRPLQFQMLAKSISSGAHQFELGAKFANRENLQAPCPGACRNLRAEGRVRIDHGRRTCGQQLFKQPHLRIEVVFQRGMVIEMIARLDW